MISCVQRGFLSTNLFEKKQVKSARRLLPAESKKFVRLEGFLEG